MSKGGRCGGAWGGSQEPQGAPEGGVGEMISERVSRFESFGHFPFGQQDRETSMVFEQ